MNRDGSSRLVGVAAMGLVLALVAAACASGGPDKPAGSSPKVVTSTPSQLTKTTRVTALDGTWEVSYTHKECLAAGAQPSEDYPENWGRFIFKFHRGDFEFTASVASGSSSGTYVVDGDTVTLYPTAGCCVGEVGTLTWSVYKDQLTFTGDIPTGFRVKPIQRIGP